MEHKMKRNCILFLQLFIALFCAIQSSCMDDDVWALRHQDEQNVKLGRGVWVVNEGNFMFGNSTLSFYELGNNTVRQQVFYKRNGFPLGDVAHSICIHDTLAFITVNNSGKIYILDTRNFKFLGKITGLFSPRYVHFVSQTKVYITDLYAKSISIYSIRAESGGIRAEKLGAISVNNHSDLFGQHPTEQMVQIGTRVFVNCWSFDNKILVIDSNTDQLIDSVEVGVQPASMVADKLQRLWILTDGGYSGNALGYEAPQLRCINTQSLATEFVQGFALGDQVRELDANAMADTLYFIHKGLWCFAAANPSVIIEKVPDTQKLYYSLCCDKKTGDLYLADAIDYQQPGVVYRFTNNGLPVDTFRVGINPGAMKVVGE
jgi:hypothetical protein